MCSSTKEVAGGTADSADANSLMVAVFSIFATLPILDMKEAGVGLAAAALIDATIVRAVLRNDEAARRLELVPPPLARAAAQARARRALARRVRDAAAPRVGTGELGTKKEGRAAIRGPGLFLLRVHGTGAVSDASVESAFADAVRSRVDR